MGEDWYIAENEESAFRMRQGIREGRVELEYLFKLIDKRALDAAMRDTEQELVSHRQRSEW